MIIKDNERINTVNEDLRLIENKDSLTFGTDAYLLAAYLPKRSKSVCVELGVGSGVISMLALTKKKCRHVYGFEVQEAIFDIAKRNAELNGLEGCFTVLHKDARNATSADTCGEVDAVFSNPPYMKVDSGKQNENENKNASRHEVYGEIRDFCACAKRLLKHGGDFFAVYRPYRMIDLIAAMRECSLEPKKITFIYANSYTPPSLFLISAKKGGKSGLVIDKPVYIYKDGTTEYTEQFKKIYECCSFEE
ncbi:MAG: methyltransferase [Clostridia bacterium]|nr:methyltransferase [Clostridia bacterium]